MAYFDSPKNRAIWERELRGLRAEKERRAREGYTPNEARSKAAQVKKEENPFRRRTSLKELERQEQEAREAIIASTRAADKTLFFIGGKLPFFRGRPLWFPDALPGEPRFLSLF